MTQSLFDEIDDYEGYFDQMYMRGLPCLLNEDGGYLSFLAMMSATDALAGLLGTSKGTGERFREFIERYYPNEYKGFSEELWGMRNSIVHSFNPGTFFALTVHVSRFHLKSLNGNGPVNLNAENLYAALLHASRNYFESLRNDPELQKEFKKRVDAKDGGAPQVYEVNFNPT